MSSRRPAAIAIGAAALLVLAGCSSDGGDAADESESQGSTTVEADYFFQEGDIPDDPQRVLALWRTGSLVADLGIVPVGTLEGELLDTELTPEQFEPVADVPTVGSFEGVDIEQVIELDPDLIIGMDNGGLSIDYQELAELYPVAILNIAEPTDVWANYATIAQLVGSEDDYSSELDALDATLAEIDETYGDELGDLEVTVLGPTEGTIWVDTSKSLTYERLVAAGFGYNADYTQDPERYVEELSLENLPSLADQDIIFYDAEIDGSVSADVQALLDEPAFQELPAVQAGHAYPIRGGVVYTFAGSNFMVDDLLAAAEDFTA